VKRIQKIIEILFSPLLNIIEIFLFSLVYLVCRDCAFNYLQRVSKRSLKIILKLYGATIGKGSSIQPGQIFHNCFNFKNLIIGKYCHIGKSCFFDLRDKITICDNVTISMQSTFITHTALFNSELKKERFQPSSGQIIINSNVYIGAGSTILQGVTIENNSVVGAKSLVNKTVKRNSLYAGIPAKKIKSL